MKSKFQKISLFTFVSVMALLGMALGALITHSPIAEGKDRYSDLQLFTKVLNLVEQHYVEEVDTKKLIYGGIKGMLASLDPHTNFLPPEIFKEFKVETSGEFGGIGIEISVQDDVLTVISPIEDTPAYKAGIKAGDKIVEIEGKTTKGITLAEAVNRMRGKRGSPVSLAVYREGFDSPKKFTVARDIIKVKSVKYTDMLQGYAYIRITSFIERTGDDLREAIDKHEKKNGKLKGLVVDLRNNPGGLLDQAIEVCNNFISDGIIVSTRGRNKKDKDVVYARKEGARTDFPIIVLMNEYSASASEIVGGALQDHKRAIIMGTRSFGKGSVQSVVDLGDGAGLKLTVARYYTPSGRSIQAEGIEPDIHLDTVDIEAYDKAVIHRKAMREADMEGHLINDTIVAADKDTKTTVMEEDSFWKKEKKDAKELAKEKEEEEAKLPPNEKLLHKDFQVREALNYLKAGVMFKGGEMTLPQAKAAQKPVASVKEIKTE
jgi:carboxyl-terminal processing protease